MYLKHEDLSKYLIFDIEANGLDPDRVWCVVVQNVGTKEVFKFYGDFYGEFRRFVEAHKDCYWVGHYILGYDLPVLQRLLDVSIPIDRVIDTLVLSILYHPKMPGGHSLEAYGERFGYPKVKNDEWMHWHPLILERCETDVEINRKLFVALTRKMRTQGFSEKSCELEHKFRVVINEQQNNGFRFDVPGANILRGRLSDRKDHFEQQVHEVFPPELCDVGTYQRRRKLDGDDYATYLRHQELYPELRDNGDGTYTTRDWKEFNIGSSQQRLEKLLTLGFVPTKLTEGGNPSVDEESLVDFANEINNPQVKAIADWMVVSARLSMLDGWLENQKDGYIHGRVNSCGAGSRRCTHSSPNTANVPGNEATYGHEVRSLWIAREGRVLVGYDAKSAQMRCFAHYLPNPADGERFYLEGHDPHQENADLIGIKRRPVKNVFYANMFGAGPPKLAVTAGKVGTEAELKKYGKWIRGELYRVTPGLEALTKDAQAEFEESEEGWIRCLDGGYVRCPSKNAALNYRIQSAEAVLMKQGAVYIWERYKGLGLDQLKVGDIHDEGQHDVNPRDAEEFGKLAVQCLRDSGETFGLRVPFDGDYRIGQSWAETH